MANEQQHAKRPRPTAPDGHWKELETETIDGQRYPAPEDWTITVTTETVVLWERPSAEDASHSNPQENRDFAILVTREQTATATDGGLWFTFALNHDPILTLHNPEPAAAWDVVSETLIRAANGDPLLELQDLKTDSGPFEHAENVCPGNLEDAFHD